VLEYREATDRKGIRLVRRSHDFEREQVFPGATPHKIKWICATCGAEELRDGRGAARRRMAQRHDGKPPPRRLHDGVLIP
jgi:hypothetical protein